MKKLLAILLSVMMIVGMMVFPTAAADQEGDLNYGKDWYDISWYNTTDTVFEISTAKQLYGLAYLTHAQNSIQEIEAVTLNKTFKLTADIDLNPDYTYDQETQTFEKKAEAADGASLIEFPGILRFCGTLDGQGYTISGLYMETLPANIYIDGHQAGNSKSTAQCSPSKPDGTDKVRRTSPGDYGFICRIYDGTVKNLVMTNGVVKNGGPLIGTAAGNESVDRTYYGATIENVYVDVDAVRTSSTGTSGYMGGIINVTWMAANSPIKEGKTAHIELNNVVYAGKMIASTSKLSNGVGGIFGFPQLKGGNGGATVSMTNCLFLGEIDVGTTGTPNGAILGTTSKVGTGLTQTNCYESATALATAMTADATLANNWKTTDKGVVPATVAEMLNDNTVNVSRSTPVENEANFSLRILQGIDDLNWKSVGFRVELWDATNETWYKPVDSTVTKVYTSIKAAGETVKATDDEFKSAYIYGVVINGVPASGTVKLRITPLKEMVDGTVVCYLAQARICEIVDGVLPQA